MAAAARTNVLRVMSNVARNQTCAMHGAGCSGNHDHGDILSAAKAIQSGGRHRQTRTMANAAAPETEYAFEVAASQLRFGEDVTREVGMDFANWKAQRVAVFTDPTVAKTRALTRSLESLEASGVKYDVFDKVRVEPNQESWAAGIEFARKINPTHFLAVGGGSVIDTAKVANLYHNHPDAELLDFVNAPVGKGQPINKSLSPLIAVPTTAGTGSETTGTAIFDYTPLSAKTGIANRALRPTLGIVDSLNTASCPRAVHISAGLDVLFHSLESYTAIPYNERIPRPKNPLERPAYQGRNPISDVFSQWALRQTVKYLPRIARDQTDHEAMSTMLLASTFAGIGFGNAGVHLCHGLSYPISGLNKTLAKYKQAGYEVDSPIVPHGISPAVFNFTAPSSPDRHRIAAEIFNEFEPDNVQTDRVSDADIGELLHDRIARFLVGLGLPRGLSGIGYKNEHIPALVKGAIPQRRVLNLAPGFRDTDGQSELTAILERAMSF